MAKVAEIVRTRNFVRREASHKVQDEVISHLNLMTHV